MPWPRGNKPMERGWAKRRARVLAGNPACAVCKRRAATEVDHVTPRHLGGAGGAPEANLPDLSRQGYTTAINGGSQAG